MDIHTYSMTKPSNEPGKHLRKDSKYLVDIVGKNWATAIVWIFALSISWKIFRCGGRTNLTCLGWVVEHSVFGSPVQYVPEENYARELEGTYLDEEDNLRW